MRFQRLSLMLNGLCRTPHDLLLLEDVHDLTALLVGLRRTAPPGRWIEDASGVPAGAGATVSGLM